MESRICSLFLTVRRRLCGCLALLLLPAVPALAAAAVALFVIAGSYATSAHMGMILMPEVSADEWEDLGIGEATPLALRQVQVEEAEAGVAAARAALAQELPEGDMARMEALFRELPLEARRLTG